MRAVVLQGGALEMVDAADPTWGPGEALVRTLAAGICGTDLHCVRHAELFLASSRAVLGYDLMDLSRPVVLGHEFCAEVRTLVGVPRRHAGGLPAVSGAAVPGAHWLCWAGHAGRVRGTDGADREPVA